jgi:hypothetical protein
MQNGNVKIRHTVIQPTPRRHPKAVATTITLDVEAKYLLLEMAGSQSFGAFIAGLIRAEYVRTEERQRLRAKKQEV